MEYAVASLATESEFSQCASLMMRSNPWNKLYFTQDQCEDDLARPEMTVHGAVSDDGAVLGFLAALANGIGFEPMIEYLCVDPGHRNKGIGSALITHFEDVQFPAADNLYLFVSDINPDAIRLYEAGLRPVGCVPQLQPRRPDRVPTPKEQASSPDGRGAQRWSNRDV